MGIKGTDIDPVEGAGYDVAGTVRRDRDVELRFERRRRLGAGGMGVVYEAYDARRDAVVALKTLRKVDPAGIYSFKREFRSLANVRHRNLVTLYELVADGERWSLTMELIAGVDFMAYVRSGSVVPSVDAAADQLASDTGSTGPAAKDPESVEQPTMTLAGELSEEATEATSLGSFASSASFSGGPAHKVSRGKLAPPLTEPEQFDRLRRALVQLAQGVMAIHASGFSHGDLKPSNVMVDGDERIVVLDFGIVRELSLSGNKGQSRAGTPAYAAPEVWSEEGSNAASDWYSVGVMLFEALAGQRPFLGTTTRAIVAKQAAGAPTTRKVAPEAPEDLHSLCADLLERDPAKRPSGAQILARLGAGGAATSGVSTLAPVEGDAILVGRERELAALHSSFELAAAGVAQTAMVHGTSGLGKSALVDQFLRELARDAETVVLSGRCYQRESVPHKALDSLVDALAQHLESLASESVTEMLPAETPALAKVFPVLARVAAVATVVHEEQISGDAHEMRRRACVALRTLLSALCKRGPVVLHIDDAQWGDLDSARFLLEVMREPGAPSVMIVLGYRTEEAGASPFLTELGKRLPGGTEVAVMPLGNREARELARLLLGELSAAPGLAGPIAREAQGSPFFIAELARYCAARNDTELGVVRLRDLVRARVAELSQPAQQLLTTLSVAGHPLGRMIVLRAAALGEHGYAAAEALCAAQLARASGGQQVERLETFHDRIREAMVASLSSEQLAAQHLSLAETLEEVGGADAETLAQHWYGAGAHERAASCYADAGDRAAAALAFDRSAALYDRSLTLDSRSGSERLELLGKLGDSLANAGRGSLAAAAYTKAADECDGDLALDYRSRAAGQLLRCGDIDDGLRALGEVLRALGAPMPKSRVGLIASILYQRLRIRIRGLTPRAFTEPDAATDGRSRLDLYFRATTALGYIDPLKGFALQCRYLRAALDSSDPSHTARALACESNFQSFVGPAARQRCRQLTDHALAISDAHADPMMQGFAHYGIALAHYQFGELREARTTFAIARGRFRAVLGGWWETCIAEEGVLWCLYYLGDLSELVSQVESLLHESHARGDRYFQTNLCLGRPSLAWLVRDDVQGGREVAREALASWTVGGYQRQHSNALVSDTNSSIYTGDHGRAWEQLDGQWKQLTKSSAARIKSIRTEAWHLRARAALAAATVQSEPAALLAEAEAATRRVEAEQTPFSAALVPLQQAAIAHLRGDQVQAAACLREGIAACDALGMKLYRAAAERQLGLLLGGDEGAALVAEADQWMRGESVRAPDRMAVVFAPGFRES